MEVVDLISSGQDVVEDAAAFREKLERDEEKRKERKLDRSQRGGQGTR